MHIYSAHQMVTCIVIEDNSLYMHKIVLPYIYNNILYILLYIGFKT